MKPEEALRAARAAAAERDDPLPAGMSIEPTERVSIEQLMEWANIEPDVDLMRSTRKLGAPITWAKRQLVHVPAQYLARAAVPADALQPQPAHRVLPSWRIASRASRTLGRRPSGSGDFGRRTLRLERQKGDSTRSSAAAAPTTRSDTGAPFRERFARGAGRGATRRRSTRGSATGSRRCARSTHATATCCSCTTRPTRRSCAACSSCPSARCSSRTTSPRRAGSGTTTRRPASSAHWGASSCRSSPRPPTSPPACRLQRRSSARVVIPILFPRRARTPGPPERDGLRPSSSSDAGPHNARTRSPRLRALRRRHAPDARLVPSGSDPMALHSRCAGCPMRSPRSRTIESGLTRSSSPRAALRARLSVLSDTRASASAAGGIYFGVRSRRAIAGCGVAGCGPSLADADDEMVAAKLSRSLGERRVASGAARAGSRSRYAPEQTAARCARAESLAA